MANGHRLTRRRQARGSTLALVLVTVMVTAAIAAAALPVLQGAKDADDARRTAVMLVALDTSLTSANANALLKGVCNAVSRCPKFLSTLVVPVTISTPSCKAGTNMGSADVGNWLNGAPYTGYIVVAGKGIRTPLGWIHDTLTTLSTTSIEMHIDSLTLDQANYLDIAIDGSAGAGAGKLQYAEQAAIFAASGQHRYLAKYIPTAGARIKCS